jgi:hypothetical protein
MGNGNCAENSGIENLILKIENNPKGGCPYLTRRETLADAIAALKAPK